MSCISIEPDVLADRQIDSWNRLLDLVRKAHTNSKNLRKLEVTIRIYHGLIQNRQAKV